MEFNYESQSDEFVLRWVCIKMNFFSHQYCNKNFNIINILYILLDSMRLITYKQIWILNPSIVVFLCSLEQVTQALSSIYKESDSLVGYWG